MPDERATPQAEAADGRSWQIRMMSSGGGTNKVEAEEANAVRSEASGDTAGGQTPDSGWGTLRIRQARVAAMAEEVTIMRNRNAMDGGSAGPQRSHLSVACGFN